MELMQSIQTSRLDLEPRTAAHAEAMFEVLADLEIYRFLDYGPPRSVEHLRDTYARTETRKSPDGRQVWLNWVLRGRDARLIGYVQATVDGPAGEGHGAAWVAYVLSSNYWGRGYAREAVQAMIEHLASTRGTPRYKAKVDARNLRSIRLLEYFGFRQPNAQAAPGYNFSTTELLFVRGQDLYSP